MINVHHSTFDMNHQVINPKESTKVHLRNFTPPLHGLCFIRLSATEPPMLICTICLTCTYKDKMTRVT